MNPTGAITYPTELVIVSAENDGALLEAISALVTFIDRIPGASLTDIAYTCSLSKGPSRIAIVASSTMDLRERLASARSRLESGSATRLKDKSGTYFFKEKLLGEGGKLAFVFPGVMSFYPDMMRDLVVEHPECRAPFDELDEALSGETDFTPSNFIFPPAPYYRHDADIFSSGAYSQAFVSNYAGCAAMSRLLAAAGIKPDGIVGCGGGDLAAMLKSGAAGQNTARNGRVEILRQIYKIISKAVDHEGLPKTSVLSILTRGDDDIHAALSTLPRDSWHLVADLSPRMKTLAIDPAVEETALKAFANSGIRFIKLDLDRPFNTPRCSSIVPVIKKFAASLMKSRPVCDVYSCAIAGRLPEKPRAQRNDIAERWAKPVLFAGTVRKMYEDGYRVFLEVGPRGLMTSAIDETLSQLNLPFAAIAMNSIHRRAMLQLQHALAQLASVGADMDISEFFRRRGAKKLDFSATLSMEFRTVAEKRLSRAFPKLTLLGEIGGAETFLNEPKQHGTRAQARAAAKARAFITRSRMTAELSPVGSFCESSS